MISLTHLCFLPDSLADITVFITRISHTKIPRSTKKANISSSGTCSWKSNDRSGHRSHSNIWTLHSIIGCRAYHISGISTTRIVHSFVDITAIVILDLGLWARALPFPAPASGPPPFAPSTLIHSPSNIHPYYYPPYSNPTYVSLCRAGCSSLEDSHEYDRWRTVHRGPDLRGTGPWYECICITITPALHATIIPATGEV